MSLFVFIFAYYVHIPHFWTFTWMSHFLSFIFISLSPYLLSLFLFLRVWYFSFSYLTMPHFRIFTVCCINPLWSLPECHTYFPSSFLTLPYYLQFVPPLPIICSVFLFSTFTCMQIFPFISVLHALLLLFFIVCHTNLSISLPECHPTFPLYL